MSESERRKRHLDRLGFALIAVTVFAFAALGFIAYEADKARGITVAESLASVGL